jgi:hypothetical protein
MLFPYYLKTSQCTEWLKKCQAQQTALEQQLQQSQEQLKQCEKQLANTEEQVKTCEEKLRYTFLAIVMKWETQNQDVDLHVVDMDGYEFYFERHNRNQEHFQGIMAELSVDTVNGPGIEIWENPKVKKGVYKVYLNLYARHGNLQNPVVKSNLYYRDGSRKLPDTVLTQERYKSLIATVEVKDDGTVEVR